MLYLGIIYDLFECLAGQMEMNNLSGIPLFFISPVADSSLAYSNIMAEWLSTAKHNRVYLPEVSLICVRYVYDSLLLLRNNTTVPTLFYAGVFKF